MLGSLGDEGVWRSRLLSLREEVDGGQETWV